MLFVSISSLKWPSIGLLVAAILHCRVSPTTEQSCKHERLIIVHAPNFSIQNSMVMVMHCEIDIPQALIRGIDLFFGQGILS